MICYDDKHGNLSHYRVDRMDSVTMLDIPITETEQSKKIRLDKA